MGCSQSKVEKSEVAEEAHAGWKQMWRPRLLHLQGRGFLALYGLYQRLELGRNSQSSLLLFLCYDLFGEAQKKKRRWFGNSSHLLRNYLVWPHSPSLISIFTSKPATLCSRTDITTYFCKGYFLQQIRYRLRWSITVWTCCRPLRERSGRAPTVQSLYLIERTE